MVCQVEYSMVCNMVCQVEYSMECNMDTFLSSIWVDQVVGDIEYNRIQNIKPNNSLVEYTLRK